MTTTQADRFVATMAAPNDVQSLQSTADQAIMTLQEPVRSRQVTHESESAQPLGYRVLSFDGDHAVIRIWLRAAGARIQRTADDILSRLDAGEEATDEAA